MSHDSEVLWSSYLLCSTGMRKCNDLDPFVDNLDNWTKDYEKRVLHV